MTVHLDDDFSQTAADATYPSGGGVGLFVWSATQAARTDLSFDDFLLTDIPCLHFILEFLCYDS